MMLISLQEHVFNSLDNAKDNGYDYTGFTSEHAILQVAEDMTQHDSALETQKAEDLVPLIKEWQKKQSATSAT